MRERNAVKHFKKNEELEKHIHDMLDKSGHINGQERFPVKHMRFGYTRAGFASCEVIAVYNVIKDLGRYVPLSDLIYHNEKQGYMLAGGLLGTKIHKIGNLLEILGISYQKIKVRNFLESAERGTISDGSMYIVTIRTNRNLPVAHLHTFELVRRANNWCVYNRFNESLGASYYSCLDDILKNGNQMGAWYAVYQILT